MTELQFGGLLNLSLPRFEVLSLSFPRYGCANREFFRWSSKMQSLLICVECFFS